MLGGCCLFSYTSDNIAVSSPTRHASMHGHVLKSGVLLRNTDSCLLPICAASFVHARARGSSSVRERGGRRYVGARYTKRLGIVSASVCGTRLRSIPALAQSGREPAFSPCMVGRNMSTCRKHTPRTPRTYGAASVLLAERGRGGGSVHPHCPQAY